MLARIESTALSSSPSLPRTPVVAARTEQIPRERGSKLTPGLRPLRRRHIVSSVGSAAPEDSRGATLVLRATTGSGSGEGSWKRPRMCDNVGSAIDAMPRQKIMRIMETFKDDAKLSDKCSELEADIEKQSSELRAVHEKTKVLVMECLKTKREMCDLVKKAEAARSKSREPVCVICLTEDASHMIVPCGHLVLCEDCCSHAIDSCPLCRQGCQKKLRVFRT